MATQEAQQESTMHAAPRKEHQWLQQLVGEWTYAGEATAEPGKPADLKFEGTESVRSLGDLWFLAEGRGEMPGGGAATSLMTLGFDPRTKRFVGSWIGSMMAHFWVYDGVLDPAERVLSLEAEGPSMAGDGTMAKYKDVIELESVDHRVLTAYVLGDDGKWQGFMTTDYRRKR